MSRPRLADRSGSALLLTLAVIAATMMVMAFAVDLGMLYSARGEAQRAADAAALAGAAAFAEQQSTSGAISSASSNARQIATSNALLATPVREAEVTVAVDAPTATVSVRVERVATGTLFAGVLGITGLRVGARAAARATPMPTARCVKPFSVPDPRSGPSPNPDYQHGELVLLRYNRSGDEEVGDPYAWVPPDQSWEWGSCGYSPGSPQSSQTYRANICHCNTSEVRLGAEQAILGGVRAGPTEQGVDALVSEDAAAFWDAGVGRVRGSRFPRWQDSPRVVIVPLHDKGEIASNRLRFTRFAYFFVEPSATKQEGPSGRFIEPVRRIQLVE